MKTLLSFLLLAVLSSSCAEKEIVPESTSNVEEGEQPPKSGCTGLPNCH